MTTIKKKTKRTIEFHPYGETRPYKLQLGSYTSSMTEPGLMIARGETEEGGYYGGCIPVEDIDEIIIMLCQFRGYTDPTGKAKVPKIKYPLLTVPCIL